jgi:VWFA-related protein
MPFVQQRPVFRGRADVVTVDVHVVDGSGKPVTDLQAEDFTLKVDGKPRPIVTAEYVWQDVSSVSAPGRPPNAPAPPQLPSNTSPAATGRGRTVMLVVDESNIGVGNGRQAMTAAGRFLDRMGPADRVGLALIPYGHANIEPTTDRAVVRKALQRVVGHYHPIEPEPPFTIGLGEAFAFVNRDIDRWAEVLRRECEKGDLCRQYLEPDAQRMVSDARQRLTQSVRSFLALLTALARLPGPKTLILISEQLPLSKYVGDQQEFRVEASRVAAAAAAAEASVYVLRLHSPLADVETAMTPAPPKAGPTLPSQRRRDLVDPVAEDADIRMAGLENIASLTGGDLLMISGRLENVFDRIALEISGYYLLGIRAEPADRDGRPHDVGVAVRRPDLHVRARKVFVIYGDDEIPIETGAADTVNELLRIPTGATELPLAVATYSLPDPGEGQNVRVIISVEIDSGVDVETAMTVGFVLLDEMEERRRLAETITLSPPRAGWEPPVLPGCRDRPAGPLHDAPRRGGCEVAPWRGGAPVRGEAGRSRRPPAERSDHPRSASGRAGPRQAERDGGAPGHPDGQSGGRLSNARPPSWNRGTPGSGCNPDGRRSPGPRWRSRRRSRAPLPGRRVGAALRDFPRGLRGPGRPV